METKAIEEKKRTRKKIFFKKVKRFWLEIVFFLLLLLTLLFLPGQNKYEKKSAQVSNVSSSKIPNIPPPAPYPVNVKNGAPPSLSASGVVIEDVVSGVFLYKKNEEAIFSPASITKIMTALVALDYYSQDAILEVSQPHLNGRIMGLLGGEKITFENLLYGLLIHSANDAAYVLAENYPGGLPSFVEAMNRKAKEINLEKTNFTNPVGFEDKDHYTTPKDLARLANFALKDRRIEKIVGIKAITISDVTYTHFHNLQNVNELLGQIPGVAGVKTGWTENAGECLVSLVERGGRKIIIVILRSQDRFGETEKLINWVFGNFEWQEVKFNDVGDNQ